MDDLNLDDIISEDEEKALESLRIKIHKALEEQKNKAKSNFCENSEKIMSDDNLLQDNPVEPRHITTYDREIYINFSVEMTALDDNGHFKEIVDLGTNYYHIPVGSGVDYKKHFDEFLENFNKQLGQYAKKITVQVDDTAK